MQRAIVAALAALLLSLVLLPEVVPAADPGPAEVVESFNRAISSRNLDAATALFAKGSVQYTLRAAHAGVTTNAAGITSDLKAHWGMVGPLLFSVTSTYQRVPEILDSRIDGDLATVWTRIASDAVERNGKKQQDNFSEVYLLVRTGGRWLIGAIADNRGTDTLNVAPTAPAKPR